MKTLLVSDIQDCLHARCAQPSSARIRAICTDSRAVEPDSLFVAITGERFDGHDYVAAALQSGSVAALVSRQVSLPAELSSATLLYVDDTIEALGRLAAWYRAQLSTEIIAITGSNGKTTTRRMIHDVLALGRKGGQSPKSYNNNIGVPLTLLSADPSDDFLVVEAGTNAPGEIDYLGNIIKPDIAVITNVGQSHLEKLGSVEGIAAEKVSLLRHLRSGGVAVVNIDTLLLERAAADCKATIVTFGGVDHAQMRLTAYMPAKQGCRFELNGRFVFELPIPGRHNALNAIAAISVARRMGMEYDQVAGALRLFSPAGMRMEYIAAGSVTMINDAYNANPLSMAASLECLAELRQRGRRVMIAGDMLELGPDTEHYHRQLGQRIAESRVQLLLAVGSMSQVVADAAIQAGMDSGAVHVFKTTTQAAIAVDSLIQPGDVVLLKGSRGMRLEQLIDPVRDVGIAGKSA